MIMVSESFFPDDNIYVGLEQPVANWEKCVEYHSAMARKNVYPVASHYGP